MTCTAAVNTLAAARTWCRMKGVPECQAAVAGLMERHMLKGHSVDPNHIVIAAGTQRCRTASMQSGTLCATDLPGTSVSLCSLCSVQPRPCPALALVPQLALAHTVTLMPALLFLPCRVQCVAGQPVLVHQ
jgi:hypothetical protein